MTSSNLVPTPIVNKNGVHTTVYKASSGTQAAPAANLPAPTTAGTVSVTITDSALIMKRVSEVMANPFVTTPSSISFSSIQRTLDGYPEETQAYISEVVSANDDDVIHRMLISMLDRRDAPEDIEDVLFVYTELPDMYHELAEEQDWTDDGFDVDYYLLKKIRGSRGYLCDAMDKEIFDDTPLRRCSEVTQKQVLALIKLCCYIESEESMHGGLSVNYFSLSLKDESTVDFVARHPERVEEVWETLFDYGRTDWSLVEDMQQAPSIPLREGTL